MIAAHLLVFLALSTGALPQAAPARPNFTGEWVAERDASQVIAVTHTAETLKALHPSEGGAHALVFRMDGKPTEVSFGHDDHAAVFVTRARWEGESLVLEQMPQESQEGVRIKQVWTLLHDGRLRVAVDAIEPDGESRAETIIFKRK